MQPHNHAIHFGTRCRVRISADRSNRLEAIAPRYQAAGNDKAYAYNESAGAIAPSYQAAGNDKAQSTLCEPAVSAKSDVLGATIYRPGVSDR
jgi:hypothetical protein